MCLHDLRQIWTYQIAAFVQRASIALRAFAVELFLPFHHVCLAAVFLDEPADAIATFAGALGAFDAEHVEFSFDVTEDEIGSPRHNMVTLPPLSDREVPNGQEGDREPTTA